MKTLLLLLSLSVVVSAAPPARSLQDASTQESSAPNSPADAPGIAVVKFGWSKERIDWERDPFGGPIENIDEMRARTRNEKRIDDAKRGGGKAAEQIEREARADAANIQAIRQLSARPSRYVFVYKTSLKNTGSKTIKSIDWDYVFFDAGTTRELGRHMFSSEEKIAPGKSKELSFTLRRPPTATISLQSLNEKERKGLDERIVVMRIEYEDGTVWQRP